MRCDKARDLLVTGYFDDMISSGERKELQAHMHSCAACREYAAIVKKKAVDPFRSMAEMRPPEQVWEKIREAVVESSEKRIEHPLSGIRGLLWHILHTTQGLAATAGVVVVLTAGLVIGSLYIGKQKMLNDYLQEQVEFLASTENPAEPDANDVLRDWETVQESIL